MSETVGLVCDIFYLEFVDDELFHLHHRLGRAEGLVGLGAGDHFDQLLGNDLPRHAELVLQPAALLRLGSPPALSLSQ